ncbi:hypothetical protein AcW1_001111 [Taiwanofungus camphoratus]|nr:hypothetical protein AcW1_001111 [Antrodia cinnamomea]
MAYTVATGVNSNCNDDKKQRCTHRFAHIKFKNVPPISIFLRCLQSRLGNPRALLPAGPDYRGHSGVPSASMLQNTTTLKLERSRSDTFAGDETGNNPRRTTLRAAS